MKTKIFILGVICLFLFSCDDAPSERQAEVKKASETIDWKAIGKSVADLTEMGLVKKIDMEARKTWVDTTQWNIINAEMKEGFAKTLALYCAHKSGDQTYFIDIYDWQSGKKIAKYDAWGFKVF